MLVWPTSCVILAILASVSSVRVVDRSLAKPRVSCGYARKRVCVCVCVCVHDVGRRANGGTTNAYTHMTATYRTLRADTDAGALLMFAHKRAAHEGRITHEDP
jgi:hypothetical protein